MAVSTTTVRVRYAETDQMGVAYYANYFVWFEVARGDFLRTFGWTYRELEDTGVFLPVVSASCEYHRPARYDDEVGIRVEGRLVSAIRIAFDYEVRLGGLPAITARGQTIHAAVDRTGKPCRVPSRVVEVLQ